MAFNEYIQILRRRWVIVLACTVLGFVAGYVTAPGEGVERPDYKATTTLVANPALATAGNAKLNNLDTAALLVTTGDIPVRVAKELGLPSVEAATRDLKADADADVGSITITAINKRPEVAQQRAKAFADELIVAMTKGDIDAYDARLAQAERKIDTLNEQIFAYQTVIQQDQPNPDPNDIEDLNALQRDLALARADRSDIVAEGKPKSVLTVLQYGTAKKVDPPGIEAPKGKVQRGLLLGFLGLVLGVGGAVALDRLDTKIRTKSTAEHAFGYPVIGEVPPLPGGKNKQNELLALTRPASPVMEAYRGLRTVVTLVHPPEPSSNGNGQSSNGHKPDTHGKVLVVASGAAGEGKTTTSAHLAAVLAEVGHSVLVVSADFRRPRLDQFFGVPRDPGLTEALTADEVSLKDLLLDTPVPGVRILTSGSPARNPAPLMQRAVDLLHAARKVFDYVIVDTAPLLIANDASELIQASDAVILMARSARTSIEAAQRASELMERINAPVLGVVLVGSTDRSGGYYYYYRYKYYSDTEDRRKVKSRRRRPRRAEPTQTA